MILLLLIFYSSILVFLFIGVLRIPKNVHINSKLPQVSIVVVARDEEDVIRNCLSSLIQQNYPREKLEIILIDDNSFDQTLEIAKEFAKSYSFVKLIKNTLQPGWKSSKKAGLELARKKAKGEILLFTDADCTPPPDWIKSMVSRFENTTGLVAGFSPQTNKQSTLWNGFLIVDSFFAALFSAGGIGWKMGITCTGRNLAIRKQTLNEIGGYVHTKDSLSGDDDFILQKIAKNKHWRIFYNLGPDSVVPSKGPANFAQFVRQKQRHISASKKYDTMAQLGYVLFHLSNFACWIFLIYSFKGGAIYSVPFIFKIVVDSVVILNFSKIVDVKTSLIYIVVWEVFFPVYNIVAGPGAFLGKLVWKNKIGLIS
jgi:cellulose synthase/poly-beta-1,6-N-acetylglucosamine synthase-like glycosyltransferase